MSALCAVCRVEQSLRAGQRALVGILKRNGGLLLCLGTEPQNFQDPLRVIHVMSLQPPAAQLLI